MSIFDFDGGINNHYQESLYVPVFLYSSSMRDSSGQLVPTSIVFNRDSSTFVSSATGTTSDNPSDPDALTAEQASKSMKLFFSPTNGYFDATFSASYIGPPPSPSPPADCTPRVELDLYAGCTNGRAAVENLGGLGPDTGVPEELRYARVGTFNGRPFDLVVTLIGGSLTPPPANRPPVYSGCSGRFGMVAILAGTQVDLQFTFRDSATNAPVILPSFAFSLFDLDVTERVQVDGYSGYTLRQPETNVVDLGVGSCEAQGSFSTPCRAFRSCRLRDSECVYPTDICPGPSCSTQVPNPEDPNSLDERQQASAVTFDFESRSSFNVRWGVAMQQVQSYGARMFFAGSSNLIPVYAACSHRSG
jgi:hypothetical protein